MKKNKEFVNYSDKGFNTNLGNPYTMDNSYLQNNVNFNNIHVNNKEDNTSYNIAQNNQNTNYNNYSKNSKKSFGSILLKLFLILITILLIIGATYVYMFFNAKHREYEGTNLVINNNNITKNLKNDIIIEQDKIYLSEPDIKNFFDKYLYKVPDKDFYISTYEDNIAQIGVNTNKYILNDEEKYFESGIIELNDNIYFPLSELSDLYNFEIDYTRSDNVVIKSKQRPLYSYEVSCNSKIYNHENGLKRVVGNVKKGDLVYKGQKTGSKKYEFVRLEDGTVGYIKSANLTNESLINKGENLQKQSSEKITLLWDYFTPDTKVPSDLKKIDGVNVISPSFFQLTDDGNIKINIGQSGREYIKKSKEYGYKIWPMIQNDTTNGMDITSIIMNNFEYRSILIKTIVELIQEYDLDGINIDFENMKKDDKDVFSRFIIELEPYLKRINKTLTVDVTAPDGSDSWSLCFDRTIISDVSDYIVFMAYDQYGASSTKPGTTAGYNWVVLNLQKFHDHYETKYDKLILAIPFYTRLWKTYDGKTTNTAIPLSKIEDYQTDDMRYDSDLKQYYREYEKDGAFYRIWIENNESLKDKLELVNKYDLAGVACWQKQLANDTIFSDIKEIINVDDEKINDDTIDDIN